MTSLGYRDRPAYDKLRSILQAGLEAIQAKDDGKLQFSPPVGGGVAAPAPAPAQVSTRVPESLQRHWHLPPAQSRQSETSVLSPPAWERRLTNHLFPWQQLRVRVVTHGDEHRKHDRCVWKVRCCLCVIIGPRCCSAALCRQPQPSE